MADATTTAQTGTQTTQQTTTAPAANWYDGKADAELVGHITNKGWNAKAPVDVAIEAIKAHREAEKFIGAPADQLLRLPAAGADEATVKAFWQKLGAPANGKDGYDFTGIKNADGTPRTSPVLDALKVAAAEVNLPKETAARIAAAVVKAQDSNVETDVAIKTDTLAKQKAALATNWGPNAAVNMVIAKETAAKLGVSPEAVAALEGAVGYDKVMEMFRVIGTKIGEDKFVNTNTPTPGIMSRDQALARKAELMADGDWSKRYLNGGAAEKREMGSLIAIIAG